MLTILRRWLARHAESSHNRDFNRGREWAQRGLRAGLTATEIEAGLDGMPPIAFDLGAISALSEAEAP